MSLKYNYQTFTNVATIEDVLSNIKTVAVANNWVIDKDDIATNQELYLHNLGNGSQNLYFSLKGVITSTHNETNNATKIIVCGNTGFDTTLAYNSQPGYFSTNGYDMLVQFPITVQYVLTNITNLLSTFDYQFSGYYFSKRLLPHLFIGSIDSYTVGDTEGNLCTSGFYTGYSIYGTEDLSDVYVNIFKDSSDKSVASGLLYNSVGQQPTSNMGMSFWSYVSSGNAVGTARFQYPRYDNMVKYNTTISRTTLIKPIIYLNYSTSTDVFDYPIGELPYYACKVYPYSKAGDIITAGTRSFMVFPLMNYTDANGVAFEV